ncbi:tetraspanin-33-like isoform X1 [Lethenteron reissneri]|uniref:tetraspanin-33-like isoform X1 n=1 Tax=Lethenteron reissneri TaxID=7753 RepID=UPI002AB69BFF|nr:tetraspanin-33-like isoform X1 [Lethenteron reissneri]XP_061422914.1 tetraspanin-33-like isoform X1 [Lethenteron reissneri]
MAGAAGEQDFSFVSPLIKYLLFFFNFVFWVISVVVLAVGVYAKVEKIADAAVATLIADPAVLLIVGGGLMFLITFCGCIGALRENIVLLQMFSVCLAVVFLLQLAAGVLGFVFSDKARVRISKLINKGIVYYREDIDLQNAIDYGQQEFECCGGATYKDWSRNMYFNCSLENPSPERCGVPFSCCLAQRDEAVLNSMCGYGVQQQEQLEAARSVHTSGCIDKLVAWAHGHLYLLGGVALGLAVPQLVGIMLAQLLINQIKDQIELQRYNQLHRADQWRS